MHAAYHKGEHGGLVCLLSQRKGDILNVCWERPQGELHLVLLEDGETVGDGLIEQRGA